jgi:hypothetical protein
MHVTPPGLKLALLENTITETIRSVIYDQFPPPAFRQTIGLDQFAVWLSRDWYWRHPDILFMNRREHSCRGTLSVDESEHSPSIKRASVICSKQRIISGLRMVRAGRKRRRRASLAGLQATSASIRPVA